MRRGVAVSVITLLLSGCVFAARHAQVVPAAGYADSDAHMAKQGYAVMTGADGSPATFGRDIHRVYVTGHGPRVILLHELPGLRPEDIALGSRLGGQFEVYVPLLFGAAGQDDNSLGLSQACNATPRLFECNTSGADHPITKSLHALVKGVCDRDCGIIGMCLTGSMPLWLMPEPHVVAAVLAQPTLPFFHPIWPFRPRLDASDADIAAATKVAVERQASIYLTRYRHDPVTSHRSFQHLADEISSGTRSSNVRFKTLEIPGLHGLAHSTLVHDEKHMQESEQEFQELVAALNARLGGGPTR